MDIYDINVAIELKMQQFKDKDINITEEDIKTFLDKFYFKHKDEGKRSLNAFIKDDNITDIVNFLMSEAIINPKF